MSDTLPMDAAHAITSAEAEMSSMMPPTTVARALSRTHPHLQLVPFAGELTPLSFAPLDRELEALLHGCGVHDLGWVTHLAVRGEDRVRWLSGMVTNAVQQLGDGEGNYSFFLNAQGRIQGEAWVFREPDMLVLAVATDFETKLRAHLERYIIMDDVTLDGLCPTFESIGLAGPKTAELLTTLGIVVTPLPESAAASVVPGNFEGIPISVVQTRVGVASRFEIWAAPGKVPDIWGRLVVAGAQPCGIDALEALRVLEGVPRYGADIADRDLPQETGQTRALNFNKGCYLGQEIVERIRSRGAVHRTLRQFQLHGRLPSLPAELMAGETSVGRLTSAVEVGVNRMEGIFALGIVRAEALGAGATAGAPLTYNGGTAMVLDRPPLCAVQ